MLTTLADLTIQVDLGLHPLKSELNFPIGDKEPLDLTRSVAGKGFRWEIPMHLLDALFHAAEGSMCGRLHQSAEAERVLRDMREAVEEGTKLRVPSGLLTYCALAFGPEMGETKPLRE